MADVREKIKKLLALASSNNEHEARSALLKARKLMAEHKLEEVEFEDSKDKEVKHEVCEGVKWTTDSGEIWLVQVVQVIADNYCCAAAWNTRRGTRTHTLVLTGLEDDLAICKSVVEYAVGCARYAVKKQCRKCMGARPRDVAASYGQGFAIGLKEMYDEQTAEHTEWGLVVVKPQEVQDWEENLGHKSVRTRATREVDNAYGAGFEDGRNFDSHNKLERKDA